MALKLESVQKKMAKLSAKRAMSERVRVTVDAGAVVAGEGEEATTTELM